MCKGTYSPEFRNVFYLKGIGAADIPLWDKISEALICVLSDFIVCNRYLGRRKNSLKMVFFLNMSKFIKASLLIYRDDDFLAGCQFICSDFVNVTDILNDSACV